jgi:hypothetical protein
MTLKWLAVVVAAVSLASAVTGNVVAGVAGVGQLPLLANVLAGIVAGTAVVLAALAELHNRLNARISALNDRLVARLDEIEARTGDRNTGFVEGYLLSHGQHAEVVPFGRRGRGAVER